MRLSRRAQKTWREMLDKANILPGEFACQRGSCKTAPTMNDDPHHALSATSDDRSPDLRAEAFQGVRAARSRELAEDYVELIAELIHSQGEARPWTSPPGWA